MEDLRVAAFVCCRCGFRLESGALETPVAHGSAVSRKQRLSGLLDNLLTRSSKEIMSNRTIWKVMYKKRRKGNNISMDLEANDDLSGRCWVREMDKSLSTREREQILIHSASILPSTPPSRVDQWKM
jgi:hypothetical protein